MMTGIIAKVIHKEKLLDSGVNISIISDISHLDSNTSLCRAQEPRDVETANQSVMVEWKERYVNAASSLVSVSLLCKARKTAVIRTRVEL